MLDIAKKISPVKNEREFRAMYGGPSIAIELLFRLILSLELESKDFTPYSLLITLNFLKDPGSSWFSVASRWRMDYRTIKRHLIRTLHLIDLVLPDVNFFFFIFLLFFLIFFFSLIWKTEEITGRFLCHQVLSM